MARRLKRLTYLHIYIYIYIYIKTMYMYIYINQSPPVIIHLSLFINDLKITPKVLLKQKSYHFIKQDLS